MKRGKRALRDHYWPCLANVSIMLMGGLMIGCQAQRDDRQIPQRQTASRSTGTGGNDTPFPLESAKYNALFVTRAPGRMLQVPQVMLAVSIDQSKCLLGEPLFLCWSLVNGTQEPVSIVLDYDKSIVLEIIDNQGKKCEELSYGIADYDVTPIIVPAGHRMVKMVNLFDDYLITHHGKYQLTVRYESDGKFETFDKIQEKIVQQTCWAGKLVSDVGSIEIVSPSKSADQKALEILTKGGTGRISEPASLFGQAFYDETNRQRILQEAPYSRYALYAKFYSGMSDVSRTERTPVAAFADSDLQHYREQLFLSGHSVLRPNAYERITDLESVMQMAGGLELNDD